MLIDEEHATRIDVFTPTTRTLPRRLTDFAIDDIACRVVAAEDLSAKLLSVIYPITKGEPVEPKYVEHFRLLSAVVDPATMNEVKLRLPVKVTLSANKMDVQSATVGDKSGALAIKIDDSTMNIPLAGPNDDRFGPRFPDMSTVYSLRLRALADEAAKANGITLAHGVYAALGFGPLPHPDRMMQLRRPSTTP